jgi:N-acetylglucosamine-6-phosphate deacetylase
MRQSTTTHTVLTNGRLILPNQVVNGQALVLEGSKIVGLAKLGDLGSEIRQMDVGGRLIAPGLVDIHVHGALGHTFNEPSHQAFAAITQVLAKQGVTAVLATTATAAIADLVAVLEFARQWMSQPQPGAEILGVHLEGPYFSPDQAGAQDPAHLRTPDDGTPDSLLAYADVIRLMSLAPELPGALELISQLARLGIVPAAGHSSARDDQVLAAIQAGLCHIIHIWSGQSSTVREGPWRKPGLLEASLVFEGLTVEIIADNKHLPPTLMKLAAKCIGPDRLCAVSDATSGAGLPEGSRYRLGDMTYEVHDGVGMMLDRSAFGGSTTLLNQMVPVLTDVVDISLAEAVRMVTLTPARIAGVDGHKGSLEPGKDADIVVFEEDFSPWRVMISGQWL